MRILLAFALIIVSSVSEVWAQQPYPITEFNAESVVGNKIIIKVKEGTTAPFSAMQRSRFPVNVQTITQLHPDEAKSKKSAKVSVTRRRQKVAQYGIDRIYEVAVNNPNELKEAVRWFQSQDWVEYAEPIYKSKPLSTDIKSKEKETLLKPQSYPWFINNTGVDYAWDTEGLDGTGVIVAVLDQGTDLDHPALSGKLYINTAEQSGDSGVDDDGNGYVDDVYGYNFGVNSPNVDAGGLGHGTQVAGNIVAENGIPGGSQAHGFAKGSKLLTVETWNNAVNSYINMVPAILYAAKQGARVINMSWGRIGNPSWYEQDMINYLTETYNMVFVASAGNIAFGVNHAVFYPASYQNVLSVAHVNSGDARSNATGGTVFGYPVDVAAPGVGVPVINTGGGFNNSITGSSYAAPYVSGIAAMLIQKYPSLTGQQIAELIRTTADNIYSVPANSAIPFKLGKGRVNIKNAITEQESPAATRKPAIRMSDYTFSSSAGRQILFNNDDLTLSCDFTNYLAQSSSNLQVTLSLSEDAMAGSCNNDGLPTPCLESSQVTIVSGGHTLGEMNTLETITKDFVINLNNFDLTNPAFDDFDRIQLKLTIEDTGKGYEDYQYFDIYLKNAFFRKVADFAVGIYNDGRIGRTGTLNELVTPGIYYDNTSPGYSATTLGDLVSKAAGLLVANTDGGKVMDATPSDWNNPIGDVVGYTDEEDDFTRLRETRFNELFPDGSASFYGTFDDTGRTPPEGSIGIEIEQNVYGFQSTANLDYFLLDYNLKNKSGVDFDSLHIGMFFDWNLHGKSPGPVTGYQPNKVAWNDDEQFGYVYNDATGQYMGVYVFNANRSYYALDLKASNIGDSGVDIDPITGGFSNAEKFQALSNRVAKKQVTTGSDVAQMIGTTLYNIPNNEGKRMVAIVFFSPTEANLVTVKNKAIAKILSETNISQNYIKPEIPVVNTSLNCPTASLTLRPDQEGVYNFYKVPNLNYPIFTGRELIVAGSDIGETYHITAIEEVRESDPAIIETGAAFDALLNASFTAPTTVNRSQNPLVTFTNTSIGATTYEWSFGDGSAVVNTVSPTHNFKAEGNYTVTLTINKGTGCEQVATQPITIQSESPTPTIASPISAEEGTEVILSPTGGTNFNFYDAALPSGTLLNSGTSFTIASLASDRSIFITNIDSALESDAIEVQIIATSATNKPIIAFTEICKGKTATLSPLPNSGTFRFYSDFPLSSSVLLAEGSEWTTPTLTTTQRYYVTQIEGGSESDTTIVDVVVNSKPTADFETQGSLIRTQNPGTQFSSTSSNDVVSWEWNFANEQFSDEENPINFFGREGTFTVTLTVENDKGCQTSVQKEITLVSESPLPELPALQTVCPNGEAVIAPSNGTNFEFYADEALADLLDTGSDYTIANFTENTSIYVVNIDSAIASEAKEVALTLDPITIDFTVNEEMVANAAEAVAVQFTVLQEGTSYTWNFGNGTTLITTEKAVTHFFTSEGTFTVEVELINEKGCTAKYEQVIEVKADKIAIETGDELSSTDLPVIVEPNIEVETTSPFTQLSNDLIIEEGAMLAVPENATLIVEGNLVVKGTLFQGDDARIVLKGNATIELNGRIISANDFPSLVFQNTEEITLKSISTISLNQLSLEGENVRLETLLDIYDALILNSSDLITSDAFGLKLHSLTEKTAVIYNRGDGVVQGDNVCIQRFIPNNSVLPTIENYDGLRYHNIASPVKGMILRSLDDEVATGQFELDLNPAWNSQNGNVSQSQLANFFGYDEQRVTPQNGNASTGWFVPSENSLLELGRGYAISINAGATLTFKGMPNNGEIFTPITRGADSLPQAGWALLGNPYPSPILVSGFLAENAGMLENEAFIWVATGSYEGLYAVTTAEGFTVPGGIDLENVAAVQGFFTRKKETGVGQVRFTNAMRSEGRNTFYREATNLSEAYVRLQVSQKESKYDMLLIEDETLENGNMKPIVILPKFLNFSTSISIVTLQGEQALISKIDAGKVEMPLQLNVPETGEVTLSLTEVKSIEELWLEDKLTGTWENISEQQSYTFNTEATQVKNRFVLHRIPTEIAQQDPTARWEGNKLFIDFPTYYEQAPDVQLFDVLGRKISTKATSFSGLQWETQTNFSGKLIILRMSNESKQSTFKLLRQE